MPELSGVSSCFHNDWMKSLIKDCEREAEEFGNIKMLQSRGRAALWNICTLLGFRSYGIPGHACQILERYLYSYFMDYTKITDPRLQTEFIKKAKKRCLVMITSSILIAAKMNSSGTLKTNASVVRHRLLCKGISLSVDEIIATQMDIYVTIKFQIPLWNTVDIALFLASELNVTIEKMKGVALIVDLSELYKMDIENDLRKNNQLPHQFRRNGNIIGSLYLAAGAIAASSRLSNDPDPSSILTHLVKIPTIFIQCLCDTIVKKINGNHQLYQSS